ncbi:MAG TPA: hypothetical protein EYP52_03300, partial [Anaerolineae bacterium]|nr:hypothetical protein [Anaerolineae bacterium]
SAPIAALVASGLPPDQFVFLGFLPRQRSVRRALLEEVAHERRTLVAFESPRRLRETLADLEKVLGDRTIAVCRELTKRFEEVWRGRRYTWTGCGWRVVALSPIGTWSSRR